MKRFSYAIFDMDGTLVDSMPYWRSLHVTYAREYKPDLTEEEATYLAGVWGTRHILDALAGIGLATTKEELFSYYEKKMAFYYAERIREKPEAVAHLDRLKEAGVRMGVITMTPHVGAEFCLENTGLSHYFSFVLTPEDTPRGTGKEDPHVFRLALSLLGCKNPADCAFYEDSLYAMRTARQMGFYIRAVEERFGEQERKEVCQVADEILSFGYNPIVL